MILLGLILGYIFYRHTMAYFDNKARMQQETVKIDYNQWKDGTNG